MRILWITNRIFPDACKALGIPVPYVGGWMYSGAKYLLENFKDIQLGIASLYQGENLKKLELNNLTHFLVPQASRLTYNKKLESYWKEVKHDFNPDVVHIHGTEYPHGLAYVNACGNENVVISVQGLISVISRYFLGGINEKELYRNITLRDLVKRDTIFKQQKQAQNRGELEKLLIKKINHIIGRTSWDRAHIWATNPQANYYFANETLRSEFYKYTWQKDKCNKYQIFLSQSQYAIKGLHQVIKALPLILRHYPDAKVVVAGRNFLQKNKSWKLKGFEKYIQTLIKKTGVTDKIIFTGVLSEVEMVDKYLESNVFVCPSSIENSSNSIGEAQLVGLPVVASYVGGTADMVFQGETGLLYRFEEHEMLAHAVCRIFSENELADKLSKKGKMEATNRHNQLINAQRIYSIYQDVCKK